MTRHARESERVPGTKKPDIAEEGLTDGMEANHLALIHLPVHSTRGVSEKKRQELRCAMKSCKFSVSTFAPEVPGAPSPSVRPLAARRDWRICSAIFCKVATALLQAALVNAVSVSRNSCGLSQSSGVHHCQPASAAAVCPA
jgi:hypothetical protein